MGKDTPVTPPLLRTADTLHHWARQLPLHLVHASYPSTLCTPLTPPPLDMPFTTRHALYLSTTVHVGYAYSVTFVQELSRPPFLIQ